MPELLIPRYRCPDCGLFFLNPTLAIAALYCGCPGCDIGVYGLRPYRTADGTEIPDRPPRPARTIIRLGGEIDAM